MTSEGPREPRRFRVDDARAGFRVDQFLVHAGAAASAQGARRLIAAGRVTLDGRKPRKGDRVVAGQVAEVEVDSLAATGADDGVAPAAVLPDPGLALELILVDSDLVGINKPAGVPSHPLQAGERGTAANALVARFPECATAGGDPREAGLGHRLDRDTSGVLLAARSRPVWQRLRASLGSPDCQKCYLAEVWGDPPDDGSFDGAIGRRGRRGGRVMIGKGRNPLPAHTDWQVLERRAGSTLVRARLHAGRAHQVRAHLAAAGYPILGDALYGGDDVRAWSAERGITSLRLHAESVRVQHPVTGAPLFVVAPSPDWAKLDEDGTPRPHD
ncbi:MAG TPA: RluA family pseudouridine synthase [Polyangia bacterium]|nr:RluA family pseudouridine synthase [Polyangia bacterium]